MLDLHNFFRRPDGVTPLQNNRGHFWELGMRGFRLHDVLRRLETHFEVVRHYRNADWMLSHNFVLRSRTSPPILSRVDSKGSTSSRRSSGF